MRPLLLAAALGLALPAAAQDIDDDDGGRGFLTSRIENLLSGAGREVRIEGFQGALSSRATLDRLTIADDEGVWLTIEDAAFDWNRSALFDRRLEIEELSAAAITLERIPEGEEDGVEPPRATAREFSLPELPVAVDIERVAAGRVTLGEVFLGERAVLSVEGSARLSDGTADAAVEAQRLDAAEGRFVIDASFDPEAGGLDLDLTLAEAEGGLAATLLGLPGEPAVELTADAQGVPEDLAAEFRLATAGTPRLSGTFGLEGGAGARRFALDASGDVSPLVSADLGAFFGDALDVAVEGAQVEGGGFDLDTLRVAAAELSLEGSASVAADGLPDAFDLSLRIEDGGEVLLPGGVRIGSADLQARFDADEGERWTLSGGVERLAVDAATVALLGLDGGGTISREGGGAVTGRASIVARGIAPTDPGLAQAVGEEARVRLDAAWERGGPVTLNALDVAAGEGLSVVAEGALEGLTFDGTAEASIADLARLRTIAGQEGLAGALDARFEGSVQPVSGAFDGVLTGTGRDLATGIEAADALIGGEADLRLDAARTVEGTEIRRARIATEALEATVEGTLTPEGEVPVDVRYAASLDDVGRVLDGVSGAVSLEGSALRDAEAWRVSLDADAPEQGTVTLAATVPDEGDAEVDFDASVADLGSYVPQLPGPAEIVGEATRTGGDWTARLTADLPEGIGADVSGTFPAEGAAVANVDARVADLGAFVEALPGQATFTGRVTREGDGAIDAVFMAALPEGIGAEVQAEVPVDGPIEAQFDARVEDLGAFVEQLPGRATLSGTATRDDGGITAAFDLDAPEGITANVEASVPADGPLTATFDAEVAEVGAFTEALEGPARLAGTATREGEVTVVDASLQAPEGIEAALDARLEGERITADFDANVADVGAFTGALEGPASVIGTAVRDGGETRVTLEAAGPEGIDAAIRATLPADGPIEAAYDARVADVSALAPLPAGPATLAGTATRQATGDLSTDARLEAPAGIAFDLTAGLLASGDLEARLDGVVARPGEIREGLPGPIEAVVVARRAEGTITVDADLDAPGGTAVVLDVSLPPEGEAAVDFDLTLAEPEAYLEGLPGPVRATGTARRDEAGWTADVDASAGDGSRLVADARLPDEGRATIDFDARLAELGRFVEQLPGEATARGQAAREGGVWSADAAITAPAGISGDLSGTLEPSGDADVTFDLGIGELGRLVPQLPGAARASGTVARADGAFTADVDASGPAGLRASVEGTFDPAGAVDATFDARLADVSVFVDRLSGPVSASGTARSEDGGPIALDVAVDGPGASATEVTGTLARDAQTADLRAVGTLPLEIANPFIRPRAVSGTARFDLAVNGPLAAESLSGTVTAAGARVALPDQRISIEGIDANVSLAGLQATLDVTGEVASGGTLRVSGPISLGPDLTAGLTVALSEVVIRDPLLYQTAVSGEISVTGPLRGTAGRIAGVLDLAETEVRIPSSSLGGSGAIPFVRHEGAPLDVLVTRGRARIADEDPITRRGTPQRNSFDLDVLIRAPNQIFIRGRGLDAELGGRLRIAGTTANVIPVGQFDLIRGRLDLLGRRLTFSEGSISLQGDFVPIVRLVAVTDVDDDQIAIILEGELTEPEFRIESASGLPQDEAIARLLFGRDLRQLSPLQAARLAAAVAELSGATSGPGLIGGLREGVGLDDLDITAADDGTLALRAGAYISENIYTDLSIDEDGQTEINLNLDVTRDITVQGRANAAGETGIGIFFERDY